MSEWKAGDPWSGVNCDKQPTGRCIVGLKDEHRDSYPESYLGLLLSYQKLYTEAAGVLYRSNHGILGPNTTETPVLYVSGTRSLSKATLRCSVASTRGACPELKACSGGFAG